MRLRGLMAAGLLTSLTGCVGSAPPGDAAPVTDLDAWLRVENQSYIDFSVFVWRQDTRQRLGRSTANTSVTFRLPPHVFTGRARLRFSADPIGRREGALSREVDVVPGDTVVMIIPPF